MCCLAEHPQARVVFNEVLGAADKDASRTKQKGAWPVQEAYLVSEHFYLMVLSYRLYSCFWSFLAYGVASISFPVMSFLHLLFMYHVYRGLEHFRSGEVLRMQQKIL